MIRRIATVSAVLAAITFGYAFAGSSEADAGYGYYSYRVAAPAVVAPRVVYRPAIAPIRRVVVPRRVYRPAVVVPPPFYAPAPVVPAPIAPVSTYYRGPGVSFGVGFGYGPSISIGY
ncbi:MAG: hypothetical protein AAGD07_18695 [Planctomycetota bacterium]